MGPREGEDRVMQIQVNTDSNVTGREELADRIAAMIEARLTRFADHLTGLSSTSLMRALAERPRRTNAA